MLRISEVFYSWSFSERVDTRDYNRIYIQRGSTCGRTEREEGRALKAEKRQRDRLIAVLTRRQECTLAMRRDPESC